ERLLHTFEVYSIAKDIAMRVSQTTFKMFDKEGNKTTKHFPYSDELLEAICFAHDVGHTPLGCHIRIRKTKIK
ncbi:MAG: HD domain-containing protein, partial [Clostridia bacterium]|nr:HD domain-containing protein [Clostridia bacterium]